MGRLLTPRPNPDSAIVGPGCQPSYTLTGECHYIYPLPPIAYLPAQTRILGVRYIPYPNTIGLADYREKTRIGVEGSICRTDSRIVYETGRVVLIVLFKNGIGAPKLRIPSRIGRDEVRTRGGEPYLRYGLSMQATGDETIPRLIRGVQLDSTPMTARSW